MNKDIISEYWYKVQRFLFPFLEERLGELSEKHKELIGTLELVRIESFIRDDSGYRGRPSKDRCAIARAFIAKAVYNFPTTRQLLDRLKADSILRQICGFESIKEIPDESTFSRAFGEFSRSRLPEIVHEALIRKHLADEIIGHISRDSTAIEGRAKPEKKAVVSDAESVKPRDKRGRPKSGEVVEKKLTRLEKQQEMTVAEMIADLPQACDVGTKKNSKGYKDTWIGYKFHIDAADGQLPISCILTSASVHDSQVALPLAELTSQRVSSLYDLMDSAYDSPIIKDHSRSLGHIPIVDTNPRRNVELKAELQAEAKRLDILGLQMPAQIRYNERTNVERVNSRLKDSFGGRTVRVKGHLKVRAHLMFGILALTADQFIRLIQ